MHICCSSSILVHVLALANFSCAGRFIFQTKQKMMMSVNMSLKSIVKMSAEQLQRFVTLIHGSRRPTEHPEFLSLEITREGFATGGLAALLETSADKATQRDLFQTDHGFPQMQMLLNQGNYTLDLPENAAMLVVAWLLEQDREAEATELLRTLSPWMDTVKFIPSVAPQPVPIRVAEASLGDLGAARDQLVNLECIGKHRAECNAVRSNPANVQLMHLQAEAVVLISTTLGEGTLPVQGDDDKNAISAECAHPFQKPLPDTLVEKAKACIAAIDATLSTPNISNRHAKKGSSIRILQRALQLLLDEHTVVASTTDSPSDAAAADLPKLLLARMAVHVREIMASIYSRRSLPGTDAYARFMLLVDRSIPRDTTAAAARVVLQRLKGTIGQFGAAATIDAVQYEQLVRPPSAIELSEEHVCPPRAIPDAHRKAVALALHGTLQELIDVGVVRSAEHVGIVATALGAKVAGSMFTDVRLARLYTEMATAFSRRRSLLLISGPGAFQHQVRLSELPWAVPILSELKKCQDQTTGMSASPAHVLLAQDILVQLWSNFPTTLMPNKVSSAISALFSRPSSGAPSHRPAREALTGAPPVLEELAADIFGGGFSPKYCRAARIAAECMRGTLYSRYYFLDASYAKLLDGDGRDETALDGIAAALASLLYPKEAGAAPNRGGWSVSGNGKVIEAAQLITTHNMILYDKLMVGGNNNDNRPRLDLPHVVERAWSMYVSAATRAHAGDDRRHWKLASQQKRQMAIAWRQIVFFVSKLSTPAEQLAALQRMKKDLRTRKARAACKTTMDVEDALDVLISCSEAAGAASPHAPTEVVLGWR